MNNNNIERGEGGTRRNNTPNLHCMEQLPPEKGCKEVDLFSPNYDATTHAY